jgi:recombination protein RecA
VAVAKNPVLDLVAKAQKKYKSTIGPMGTVAEGTTALSTGNISLDFIIGVGGIPLGRSTELFGPPSCGKTTTALQAAAELQRIIKTGGDAARGIAADDYILYCDFEQAMDPDYAKALGLDVEDEQFLFFQPDTLEDGANFALDLVKTGKCRLIIFDSIAAMNPSTKAEAEIGKSLPAVQAKLLKDFGMNMNTVLYNNNCAAIYLNHEVEVMDMGGGRRPGMPAKKSTPGGVALKYFASVRIRYQQIGQIKAPYTDPLTKEDKQRVVATDVIVRVEKNKVARPFGDVKVRVRFGRGFDNFWSALQILIAHKYVRYESGYYRFHNLLELGLVPDWMPREAKGTKRPTIHGENTLFAYADKYPDFRDSLIVLAEQVAAEQGRSKVGEEAEDEADDAIADAQAEAELSEDIQNLLASPVAATNES